MSPITIRFAVPVDAPAVRDLAALDSARPPAGETLLAFSGADLAAALEVATGRVVADPFRPTQATVATLRAAAADGVVPASPRTRIWRFAARLRAA